MFNLILPTIFFTIMLGYTYYDYYGNNRVLRYGEDYVASRLFIFISTCIWDMYLMNEDIVIDWMFIILLDYHIRRGLIVLRFLITITG